MKRILVTGGCGYIGSQTIIELIKAGGYEVFSADNLANSTEKSLLNIENITGVKVRNFIVDLCDKPSIQKMFSEIGLIDGVIHFAALKSVPESVSYPTRYYKNNLESLLNLIEICEEFRVHHFIFSSSCSVYGNVTALPVTEATPLSAPVSPYAHTKLMGEQMIQFIAASSKINFTLLRYFNPVGADMSGMNGEYASDRPNNLVPVITQTAIGKRDKMQVFGNTFDTRDGSCVRDYIHVIDIAEAHILAMRQLFEKKNKEQVTLYNLGSGNGVTVLEAIKAFEENTGVKVNYEVVAPRAGDVGAIYSDSSKAASELGWKPKYGIKEMMVSAWKWQNYMATS